MVLERSISMVKINGETKEIAGKNLLEYLIENGFNPEHLVVERNLEIIQKEQFGSVTIQDEDVIEVLRFVGGG
jgi:sulfur carrier protein